MEKESLTHQSKKRTIMHVDMDAFYASIEQRDHPEYKGKPVIVGSDPQGGRGRGVVSAASYEARKYGVHSAQPISQAYRNCPHGIFVPVRGRRYAEVSRIIMDIFHSCTPHVQPISLDEAFLDLTGTERLLGSAEHVGRQIKQRILDAVQLTSSVGIAPNKLLAKMGSEEDKPDGLFILEPDQVTAYLKPQPIRKLWGVGKKTEERLAEFGIHTIGQIASYPRDLLEEQFGKGGVFLWQSANGLDASPVLSDRECKSISNERTFWKDTEDLQEIRNTLLFLSEKVAFRLRKKHLCGKTIMVKIRFSDFSTRVMHHTLIEPTNLDKVIFEEVMNKIETLDIFLPVRLLGVGVSQLTDADCQQEDLFSEDHDKLKHISHAIDRIKLKFGEHAIGKGGTARNEEDMEDFSPFG